jgi:hypothetical protein
MIQNDIIKITLVEMTQMIHNCLEQLVSHKSVHFMMYHQVRFWFVIGIQNRSVRFCSNRALSKLDHLQTRKFLSGNGFSSSRVSYPLPPLREHLSTGSFRKLPDAKQMRQEPGANFVTFCFVAAGRQSKKE